MAAAAASNKYTDTDKMDKNVEELQMPVVDETDYLLPQSGAAASYMDVVADNAHGISFSVLLLYNILLGIYIMYSESECKCLTCNQKPTGSQFSLLHEPN